MDPRSSQQKPGPLANCPIIPPGQALFGRMREFVVFKLNENLPLLIVNKKKLTASDNRKI